MHSVVWEENNSVVAELSGWGDGKCWGSLFFKWGEGVERDGKGGRPARKWTQITWNSGDRHSSQIGLRHPLWISCHHISVYRMDAE